MPRPPRVAHGRRELAVHGVAHVGLDDGLLDAQELADAVLGGLVGEGDAGSAQGGRGGGGGTARDEGAPREVGFGIHGVVLSEIAHSDDFLCWDARQRYRAVSYTL